MSKVAQFHSINENLKPPTNRVHHDNSLCAPDATFRLTKDVLGPGAIDYVITVAI
jgi:hypothetical protein